MGWPLSFEQEDMNTAAIRYEMEPQLMYVYSTEIFCSESYQSRLVKHWPDV